MRVLVTRPEEDADQLISRLGAIGVEVLPEPLLFIDYLDGPAPSLNGVQALLATSANGVRALARRSTERGTPVYAVGAASAKAALDAGFTKVVSADGDVEALAELAAARLDGKAGSLLHVAGSEVAGDLRGLLEKHGFTYRREVLYTARKAERFSDNTMRALRDGDLDGVLFFSPRTAAAFVALTRAAGLSEACRSITAFCLSPAVADKLKDITWRDVRLAARPEQTALLAAISGAIKEGWV